MTDDQQLDASPVEASDATEQAESTPRVDYAERRRERAVSRVSDRTAKRGRRAPLWAAGIAVALVVVLVGADAAFSVGRVHPGVTVAGIEIGGMTPSRARATLEKALPEKAADPVVVVFEDQTWKITAEQVGLAFDYASIVRSAMSVGRGSFADYVAGRARAWFSGVAVDPEPVTDGPSIDIALDRVAESTDIPPVNSTVRIDGTETSIVDGKDGRGMNRDAARELVVGALLAKDRRVQAPVEVVPMPVTADEARVAQGVADTMLSGPAKIVYAEKSWDFEPADVAEWISFRAVKASEATGTAATSETASSGDENVVLEAFIDPRRLTDNVVPRLGTGVGRPAKNAAFKTANGSVHIIPSQDGIGPDVDDLSVSLASALTDEASNRTVELRTRLTRPALTTEKARAMGIRQRISTFTTTYDSGNQPRVNNIHLLGEALDGTLIAPGATFSFNGTVGERTADKGYREANAIVNGKLVPQLGGGICQVGTTLFNAAFESGFPILQRRNHSFYISHYPKGRDATVSWGGPDLKFKNDSDKWVLLSVSYTSYSITISLYGTDPGYEVDSSTSDWRNMRPFPTETVKDPDMYVGTKVIEDKGITGRTCTVKRVVTKDGTVIREDEFISVYKPKVEVVRVGTKPKPGSLVPTPTP